MSVADEINKLNALKESGALSEDEFQQAKDKLLAANQASSNDFSKSVSEFTADHNNWGVLIHLSQFCGFIIPYAGLVVPIILWQMKKDESPIIDEHGCIVANWLLTAVILSIVFFILFFLLIGIPLFIVLVIAGIVFPIIGAVKANEGKAWRYPGSFPFFKPANPSTLPTE